MGYTTGNVPLRELTLKKSNQLIAGKYKSTLLENQVMAVALTRIEVNEKQNRTEMAARLYPGELRDLIGDPSHIYRTLKSLTRSISGHTIFMEDGQGNFNSHAIVADANYTDGVFTIRFNENLREHVLGLEKNYKTMELAVLTDFHRNCSFRLYELLKKEMYKSKSEVNGGRVDVEYNVSELKFMIGIANTENQTVKNAMGRMGEYIDWDELYDKLDKKDKLHESWREFRRCVILPAQAELEEKSDIRFEFDGIREGRFIKRILFHVYPNKHARTDRLNTRVEFIEKIRNRDRQMEIPMDLSEKFRNFYEEFVGHNGLIKEDIDTLLKKADLNIDDVRSAILYADAQGEINNYMGYIIRCIENRWFDNEVIGVFKGSSEMKQKIDVIKESAHSLETAVTVWEKIKNKEEFQDFLEYEKSKGISFEVLDMVFTPNEAAEAFIDWKKMMLEKAQQ